MTAEIGPPPIPLDAAIDEGLRAASPDAFRRSAFYREYGAILEEWLAKPRVESPPQSPEQGSEGSIRFVHWNIQQGKWWDRLVSVIDAEPKLRDADIWSLNEVDIGMARSGNRDVARELASRMGLHCAFVANYLEMTKGPGADREAPGENRMGLHGIAILSRWPVEEVGTARLPECWDYFRFPEEKRYGCRRVLWAKIAHPRGKFLAATAHTEVRNTPRCRKRQIEAAVATLPDLQGFFAGDWNTHTFRRGGRLRQAQEFLRIVRTPPHVLDASLVDPRSREPLLARVEQAGFRLADWNERVATAQQVLSGVEELDRLPAPLARHLTRRHRLDRRTLRMRLDWIGVRGPWRPGELWTLASAGPDGAMASDHAPIGIDAVWGDGAERTGG